MYFPTEQDRGLEALSSVITRQKNLAQVIGNEVDYQNGKFFEIWLNKRLSRLCINRVSFSYSIRAN